jgi:FkbM family methyltransferase
MAFPQARIILKAGLPPLSAFKMLVIAASCTHPRFRGVCMALLRPFIRDGEVAIHYRCRDRRYVVHIRMADYQSDWMSVFELAAKGIYPIDTGFAPDLIIDGGGNTGVFTLLASATFPTARVVVCEPVPRNLLQIDKHLRMNRVNANVMPVCIGGSRRSIPFYIREANQGSFDSGIPYSSQIDVDVVTLASLVRDRDAKRILVKLDIEGMEVEALESFVPGETRAVFVVGEVHNARANVGPLQRLFERNGWTVQFEGVGEMTGNFTAWSPAADSMLMGRPPAVAS